MKKKLYTVKAHIQHTMLNGGTGFAEHTLGMDGNWYLAMSAISSVRPASFSNKIEASEFYFATVKEIKASSAFIEGPNGGHHHIVQYRG